MKLYSTKNKHHIVSLKEAVLKGLPPDNGLYMPVRIPTLPESFIKNLSKFSFQEIAFEVCRHLVQKAIPDRDLKGIIDRAINFPAPLIALNDRTHILELFHGPTLAFKDFGARFMAQLMSYYTQKMADKEIVVLVATSGDTGGAVASGFHQMEGIKVVILYPSGQVSPLQEKQLTTLKDNITALEVQGSFDDCQLMVKSAFLDKALNASIRLVSANSINIARLIPQSFYYFEGYKQLRNKDSQVSFSVPSGNFGNMTAGLLAKKMGLPVNRFIAATNANDIIPVYLQTGIFHPRPSVSTISNAMDVGNPSNFARMRNLYRSTWNDIRGDLSGFSFSDMQTKDANREAYNKYNYMLDPHGAVGYAAAAKFQKMFCDDSVVILETAHPSKFIEAVSEATGEVLTVPGRLAALQNKHELKTLISADTTAFKSFLKENF